jgi:hypothetical protein
MSGKYPDAGRRAEAAATRSSVLDAYAVKMV